MVTVDGLSSQTNGGSFRSGFISSGLSASVTHSSDIGSMAQSMGLDPNGLAYLTLSSSLIGGTTAELTGGSFEQGAQMAVTQAVFNRFLTNVYEQGGNLIEETIYVRDNDPNEACYGYKNGQVISRKVIYERGLQDDVVSEILVTGGASLLRSSGRALGGAIMSRVRAKSVQGGLNLFKFNHPTSIYRTWKPGDRFLRLPNQGTPRLNWKQNSGFLRQEMSKGKPIFDSYRKANGQLIHDKYNSFIKAERQLLKSRGWQYNSGTGAWHAP